MNEINDDFFVDNKHRGKAENRKNKRNANDRNNSDRHRFAERSSVHPLHLGFHETQ